MNSREWEKVELGDIAFVTKLAGFEYTKHFSNNFQDKGVPVIQGRNIKNKSLNLDRIKYISKELSDSLVRSKVISGDILFSYVGTVGDVYLHDSDKPLHLGSNVAKISILNKNEVCNKFIYYSFQGIDSLNKISSKTKGTVQSNINMGDLRSIEINLPRFSEQRVIAATLSCLDDMIELNNRTNRILEEMAQTIFKHWFVDFEFPNEDGQPYKSSGGEMVDSELGQIPKGWKVGSFTDLIEVCGGGTPKTGTAEYWNGEIPFFTPKDNNTNYYVVDTEKHITKAGLQNCNSHLYPENTVFITARGTVGKISLSVCPMAMNQSCYALKYRNESNPFFVHQLAINTVDALKHKANGAVFDAIVTRDFDSQRVIVSPTNYIKGYEISSKPLYDLMRKNVIENQTLTSIRESLLPKLMSGEIRIPVEEVEK